MDRSGEGAGKGRSRVRGGKTTKEGISPEGGTESTRTSARRSERAERAPRSRRENTERGAESEDTDVFLDVPVVKVDEIELEVEDLRASVSLQAEVLDLLKLKVGADVELGRVGLTIKGVEAEARLRVRLDNVREIIARVLKTIDANPQILEHVARGVESSLEEVSSGAGEAAGALGRGTGGAVKDLGQGVGEAVEDVGEAAADLVEDDEDDQ